MYLLVSAFITPVGRAIFRNKITKFERPTSTNMQEKPAGISLPYEK